MRTENYCHSFAMSSITFYFLLCIIASVVCDLPRQLKETIDQNDATCRAEELCTIVTALKRDVTSIATNVEKQATYLKVMSVAIEDTITSTLDIHTKTLTDIMTEQKSVGSKIEQCEKERKVQEEELKLFVKQLEEEQARADKVQSEAINDLSVLINDQSKVLGTLTLQEDFKEQTRIDKAQTEAINDLSVRIDDQSKVLETLTLLMNAVSSQLLKHSKDLLDHDNNLKAHDKLQTEQHEKVNGTCTNCVLGKPLDCREIRANGKAASGVYRVYTKGLNPVDVYCDMTTPGGPWLVFQRRKDGSVNFDRSWKDYSDGFGVLTGEFWLGNENLYLLTGQKKYKLRIELEDFDKQKRFAEYSTFSIGSRSTNYQLTATGFSGNAGDSLGYHSGNPFSTKDANNDEYKHLINCAQQNGGGWWFRYCSHSSLNGKYYHQPTTTDPNSGIKWHHWRTKSYSLKATEMKFAPVA